MKTIQIILLLLLSTSLSIAQQTKKTIVFSPKSELNIAGSSNVNNFQCLFETKKLNQFPISYNKIQNEIHFHQATLILPNTHFDCGGRGINRDFHSLIQTNIHPEIQLTLKRIKPKSNRNNIVEVLVDIKIAGKTNSYKLDARFDRNGHMNIDGKLKLNLNDFDLKAPKKLLGMIVISDQVEIDFNLFISEKGKSVAFSD